MLMTMMLMLILLFAFFNPSIRNAAVGGMNVVLMPSIGFESKFPVITIMFAELIVVLLGTTLRLLFTDFVALARVQSVTGALRAEMRKARLQGDMARIKKLTSIQNTYMMESMQINNRQFKILPVTIIVIFPLFAWLSVFLSGLAYPDFSVPWAYTVNYNHVLFLFPAWVFLYALLGIPFTQIYQRALRYFILKRRLARLSGT